MKLTKLKLVPGINTTESEMFFSEEEYPFGFNATVHYKKDSIYEGEVQTYHNLTEIHWLYNQKLSAKFPELESLGVALESDIHGTGGTRKLNDFDFLEIEVATEKNKYW